MAGPTSDPKFDRFSKENRWYYKDLNDHLAPQSRKLLQEYSHIPAKNVDSHIYSLVSPPPFLLASPTAASANQIQIS
jgi:hypothetical protein